MLNGIRSVEENGYTYEADARHAELLIRDLGLEEARSFISPASDERFESEGFLDRGKFKQYQSICARANFLAVDRLDLQFATKECCRAMSKPTIRDWSRMKRLGRYIIGHKRLV